MSSIPISRVHPTAEVSPQATIGQGVRIWNQVQIREGAIVGESTTIGKNSYIDAGVKIGSKCKIQNNVSIFHGVTVEEGVFLGPHCCFTNDRLPRAINSDGSPKGTEDWKVSLTHVESGASVGAGAVVVAGVRLGSFCMIGAGAVVTRDVERHALVVGNPARRIGWVCYCGARLDTSPDTDPRGSVCRECGEHIAS